MCGRWTRPRMPDACWTGGSMGSSGIDRIWSCRSSRREPAEITDATIVDPPGPLARGRPVYGWWRTADAPREAEDVVHHLRRQLACIGVLPARMIAADQLASVGQRVLRAVP